MLSIILIVSTPLLDVHERFVSHARCLLNTAQQRRWSTFQSIAVKVIPWYDEEIGMSESECLFSTSVVVVLAGSLVRRKKILRDETSYLVSFLDQKGDDGVFVDDAEV